jgi:Heterokaryon incompatibility protein (HET)
LPALPAIAFSVAWRSLGKFVVYIRSVLTPIVPVRISNQSLPFLPAHNTYHALSYSWRHEETPEESDLEPVSSLLVLGEPTEKGQERPIHIHPKIDIEAGEHAEAESAYWRASGYVLCGGRHLPVSRTLYSALLRLRHLDADKLYWIDALCINQRDIQEKEIQVRAMEKIYSRADKVIVWLGRPRVATQAWIYFIQNLPPVPTGTYEKASKRPQKHGFTEADVERAKLYGTITNDMGGLSSYVYPFTEQDFHRAKGYDMQCEKYPWHLWREGVPGLDDLKGIFWHFFHEQWFQRSWVIQEMVVAKSLLFVWGPHTISEDLMLRCVLWQNTQNAIRHAGQPTDMIHIFEARQQYSKAGHISLFESVNLIRNRKAKEPVDKVFSALGMTEINSNQTIEDAPAAASNNTNSLEVDYRRSFVEVFTQCTSYLIRTSGAQVLSLVGSKHSPALPSWVPDYDEPLWPPNIWRTHGSKFEALIMQEPGPAAITVCNKTLHAKGAILDSIAEVFIPSISKFDFSGFNFAKALIPAIDRLSTTNTYAPTAEPIMRALWRTLVLDCDNSAKIGTSFVEWFLLRYREQNIASECCRQLWKRERAQTRYRMKYSTRELAPEAVQRLEKIVADHDSEKEPFRERCLKIDGVWDKKCHIGTNRNLGAKYPDDADPAEVAMDMVVPTYRPLSHKLWDWKDDLPERLKFARERLRNVGEESRDLLRSEKSVRQEEKDMAGEYEPPCATWLSRMIFSMRGRRIFKTQKGYLGVGPEHTRPGDTILLLPAAPVPFLFRPVNGQDKVWSLVGEAYVHGFMRVEDTGIEGLMLERIQII